MERLEGRAAVVTGSARGIGRGIAERFLAEGASVLMVDILAEELASTASELSSSGSRLKTLAIDLLAEDAPRKIREVAESTFGRIDILVNNAGIGMSGRVDEFTDEQWGRTLAVNVTAPFRLAREIVPRMAEQGYGRVVNVSSFAATAGEQTDCAYAVSKAGLEALSRSIAADFGPAGVTSNCIAPGVIVTPLARAAFEAMDKRSPMLQTVLVNKPVPGEGEPADIAAAAAFLASNDAKYVTGHVIAVDGGASTVRFVPYPEGFEAKRLVEA